MHIKMCAARILWVHEDFQGPMNGLCSYNDETLWFRRCGEIKIPHIVSAVPELPKDFVSKSLEGSVSKSLEGSVPKSLEGSVPKSLEGSVSKSLEGSVSKSLEDSVSKSLEGSDSESDFSSMSDDLPQDADTLEDSKYTYDLVRLDADILKMVQDNHLAYCEATHTPVHHGDAHPVIKKNVSVQGTPEDLKLFVNEKGFIQAKFSGLLSVYQYQHAFSSNAITGEVVTTISQDDFQNFFVPHALMR